MNKYSFWAKYLQKEPLLILLLSVFIAASFPGKLAAFEYIDHPANPIFNGNMSWDDLAVISPCVIQDDSGYKMWFAGRNVGYPIQIGYATSQDGLNWMEQAVPVLTVGPTGAFDAGDLQKFTVIQEGSGYKMWYTGIDASGGQRFGLATSPDGINWTKYGQNPVFTPGAPGSWNEARVKGPTVVKVDGVYLMWFSGVNNSIDVGIGLAYSNDGINWQEDPNNPVMVNEPGNVWESEYATLPCVVQREDESFVMVYMGYDGLYRQTGLAYSPDGINWTRSPRNPMILHGEPDDWNASVSTGPNLVILEPGHYGLWYTGNADYATSTTWSIGRGDLFFEPMGDINYDYQVDVSDLIHLVNIILDLQDASNYQIDVGDLNQDEGLTIADILLLVNYILQ